MAILKRKVRPLGEHFLPPEILHRGNFYQNIINNWLKLAPSVLAKTTSKGIFTI